MIELLNLIVSALIIIVMALNWRQVHLLKPKVIKKEEEGQRKHEEPKLGKHEKDPIKVFELLRANQQEIGENMAKMQMQINKNGEILKTIDKDRENMLKTLHDKSCDFKISPIRKNIRLVIKKCNESLKQQDAIFLECSSVDEVFPFNCCFIILKEFRGKDLCMEFCGRIYENEIDKDLRWERIAKIEDLLDPTKGFLRPDGSIEVEADFTIKSAILDHLI